jgi:nucleoside-diphosphate-sugar epimerase
MVDISNHEWVSILSVAQLVAEMYKAKVVPGTLKASYQTKVNEPSRDFLSTGWIPKVSLRDGILKIDAQ